MHGSALTWLTLAFTLSAFSHAAIVVKRDGGTTTYEITAGNLALKKVEIANHAYIEPRLVGITPHEGVLFHIGFPRLPAIRFVVEGEGAIDFEMENREEFFPIADGLPLAPALEAVPRIPGATTRLPLLNPLLGARFPEKLFDVEEMNPSARRRRRLVSIYPVQFDDGAHRLTLHRRFRVIHRNAEAPPPPSRYAKETIAFVVAPEFKDSPSIARYAEFDRALGYEVTTVVVESQRRTPAAIREKLREVYAARGHRLDDVVLFGDNANLPSYPTARVTGVTDHYYRSLEKADYEANLGAPDTSLGRFSARDERDLAAMIEKNMRYRRGEFNDESWLKRAAVAASDDETWADVAEASMDYLFEKYLRPLGIVGDALYAIRFGSTGADLLDAIQNGRGFVTYGGHGDTEEWAGPEVTASQIAAVTPDEATPYVTSHACYTGRFVDGKSLAEAWERNPRGSVAIWASMDADYWGEGDDLQRMVYDRAFGAPATFGAITDRAIGDFSVKYGGAGHTKYFWEDYHLFGDPSLLFRTDATHALHAEVVDDSLVVTDESGAAVAGARVALVGHGVAYTDDAGKVPLPEGEWAVAVTARNARLLQLQANRR